MKNAWSKIDKGDMQGNVILLEREQHDLVDPSFINLNEKYPLAINSLNTIMNDPFSENVVSHYVSEWDKNGKIGKNFGDFFKNPFKKITPFTVNDSFSEWSNEQFRKTNNLEMMPDYKTFKNRWSWMESVILPSWNKNKNGKILQEAINREIK